MRWPFHAGMVDAGILKEYYDEPSGCWKVDADGLVVQVLYDVWSQHAPKHGWPAECPLDASIIVVWAYLLVSRDPAARAQLMSPARVEGGPHASEVTVDGGYLLRLLIPLPGPDGQMRNPVMVNFIDVYLQMLNDIVSSTGWRQANLPSQRRAV